MVRFWIRDHGPGIPVETQARLFSPFGQTDLVCNPGRGLGLSIVHRIVEKLGGQVGFESEASKGSLFFFTLPADPKFQ
jgi:signal transduction histidine kinase